MVSDEAAFICKKRKRKSGCFLTHLPSKVRSFVWLRNALFSVKQVERGRRLLRLLSRTGLQNKRRRPSPCDVLSACTVFMRTVSSNAFSLLQVPKCFGLVQIFCARPKIHLHIVEVTNILCQTKVWFALTKIGFCAGTKGFVEALNAVKFLGWLKKFGPAQNILGSVIGQGIWPKGNVT